MYVGLEREQEETIGLLNPSDCILAEASEETLHDLAEKAALEMVSAEDIQTSID